MTAHESLGDLAAFDPFDAAQRGTHHAVMAELRARCPVARVDSGMVVVSRFDDVRAALSERTMLNSHAARAPGVVVPPEDRLFFFEYDPPEHVPLRRLLLDLLSRQRAEREVSFIRALVEELLRGLLGTGGGEIVSQFSVPLSGRMMMRVAGFPADDALQWRRWINDMAVSGFSFTNRNDRGEGYEACYPELLAYVDDHLAARAADVDAPDDLLTRVAHAAIDGEPLSRTQQRMIMVSVVAGGSNTLVNFVSNTLLALARDPALVEALRADRDLVTAAVEESLRRDAPSMYITRLCGAATEIAGVAIDADEKVLLGLASANRDEAVYPDAESFRLDRAGQPPHVAFGWASHLCLGAPIARQVGVTMLTTFLDLVETITVAPGTVPVPTASVQGNGLAELRLRLEPRDG